MGKKKIDVNKKKLERIVHSLEKTNPIIGITEFCQLAAKNYAEDGVTDGIINLRLKEFDIRPNITKPKRRNNLPQNRQYIKRTTRKEKFSNKESTGILVQLKKEVPFEYEETVRKLQNGSMIAAIKLKCAECSDYNKSEIKHCPIKTCGLYLFRPYK